MIKEIKRFACAYLFILTIIVLAFYEELHIFLSAGVFFHIGKRFVRCDHVYSRIVLYKVFLSDIYFTFSQH